jgi:hypothetical protein
MISDAFALISCIVSIIRYRDKKQVKPQNSAEEKTV